MSPEISPAAEPEPQAMSEASRLTGVFFEPSKAFADIAERPRWFVPLLIVVLACIGFYAMVSSRVGWQSIVDQQMNTPRVQQQLERLTPEQRQQAIDRGVKMASIMYIAGPVIGLPLGYLVGATVVFVMASVIMSAGVRFKQVFAIVCYAGLTTLVTRVLATVVMFLKPPDQFNIMNPLAFNPGAFMDQATSSKFLYTLATSLDAIAIWAMILTAVGIKAAAGKKLSFGGALFAVFLPSAVLTFLGAGIAGMFS